MATERIHATPPTHPDEDYRFGAPPRGLPKLEPAPDSRAKAAGNVRIDVLDLARKSDRKRFLDVADAIQGGDPNYIAPLRMERMKFLDTAKNAALASIEMKVMIAVRGGRDVGRITAHIDRAYDRYHQTKAGWFGFFESIDDVEVAHTLLDEAVAWTRAKGADEIIGPFSFTTNHLVGLLVENFDRPPFIEQTYNPRYYERLITSYGFAKAKDLYCWWIDVTKGLQDPKMKRYHDVSQKVQKRYGLRIRHVDMDNFAQEVSLVFGLYNECWQKNWGFVPITEAEFKTIATDFKPVIDPKLVNIVEDKTGKPIAFSLAIPDLNEVMPKNGRLFPFGFWKLLTGRKKIKHGRLWVLGVAPGHRQHGVEGLMCIATALAGNERGLLGGEIGWTLEDNTPINRTIEAFGGTLYRRYRLLGLDLRP